MRAMTTMRGIDGLQAIALMKNDYSELLTWFLMRWLRLLVIRRRFDGKNPLDVLHARRVVFIKEEGFLNNAFLALIFPSLALKTYGGRNTARRQTPRH